MTSTASIELVGGQGETSVEGLRLGKSSSRLDLTTLQASLEHFHNDGGPESSGSADAPILTPATTIDDDKTERKNPFEHSASAKPRDSVGRSTETRTKDTSQAPYDVNADLRTSRDRQSGPPIKSTNTTQYPPGFQSHVSRRSSARSPHVSSRVNRGDRFGHPPDRNDGWGMPAPGPPAWDGTAHPRDRVNVGARYANEREEGAWNDEGGTWGNEDSSWRMPIV